MKKLSLYLAISALGLSAFAAAASAERYETRVVAPSIVIREGHGVRDGRLANDIEQLNREVRRVREEIRAYGGGGRRIRADFHQVLGATERLTAQFQRGIGSRHDIRRRADGIRVRLNRIRQELRLRGDRPAHWR